MLGQLGGYWSAITGRILSVVGIVLAIPVMAWLLGKAAFGRIIKYGIVRTIFIAFAFWLGLGVLSVILTPRYGNPGYMHPYPKYACEGSAPGSWPVTKILSKVAACSSWSYEAMARSVGLDDLGNRIDISYGTMIAGLTAGGMNRDYLLQGVLLVVWIPVALIYLPLAGAYWLIQSSRN